MIRHITNYFQKTEGYSTSRFIFEIFFITLVFKILLSFIFFLLVESFNLSEALIWGELDKRAESILNGLNWFAGFVLICVFAPFFESIIGQVIPIHVISFISKSRVVQLFFSAIINTLFHYPLVIGEFAITFILSIFLAWGYILYRNQGIWKAILIITTIHGLYNFIPYLMIYLFPH
jgi:hypothetical protein